MPLTSKVYRQPHSALLDEIVKGGRVVCLVYTRRIEGVFKDEKRTVPDDEGERYAKAIEDAISKTTGNGRTMTEAPDKIRVAQDADGFWTCREAVSGSQQYTRDDLVDKLVEAIGSAINALEIEFGVGPARLNFAALYDARDKATGSQAQPLHTDR